MTVPGNALVFDTGPLRHFAVQGWLGVLRFLAADRPVYIPDAVERELDKSAEHATAARAALDADWILVHRSTDADFGQAFAHYADRLVVDGKNRGECGVLAMGEIFKCEVVIDDATPRRIATEKGWRVPPACTGERALGLRRRLSRDHTGRLFRTTRRWRRRWVVRKTPVHA